MSRYKKRKLLVKLESYSESSKNPRQRPLQKTVNDLNLLTNFAQSPILDARLGSEYAPVKKSV